MVRVGVVIYDVVHTTRYDYSAPVVSSFATVRQMPDDIDGQVCLSRTITTEPTPEHRREHLDYFGNLTATMVIRTEHRQLVVTSSSTIDTGARPTGFGIDGRRPWWSYTAAALAGSGAGDLVAAEFTLDSTRVARSDQLARYAAPSFVDDTPLADAVMSLCGRIHRDFVFDPVATQVDTPLVEVMEMRRGVCQDFAHVMVGAMRSMGLPASYVSGYLETVPPPGTPRLVGADRTHAWVGVYLGDGRWIGVDPTNDQIAGPRYVTAARGRDYHDVPPLRGVIFTDADKSRLTVSVDVAARG